MLFLFTLIVCVAVALYGVGLFNALHIRRVACDGAFTRIPVQLQRRYDLLSNLARVTKPHAHDSNTFDADAMLQAHARAVAALAQAVGDNDADDAMQQLAAADNEVTTALRALSSFVDKRPGLRADAELTQLREELISTENKIVFARRAYNDAVADYQTRRNRFPASWLARVLSLRSLPALGTAAADVDGARADAPADQLSPPLEAPTGAAVAASPAPR